jgi:hypothetical protein
MVSLFLQPLSPLVKEKTQPSPQGRKLGEAKRGLFSANQALAQGSLLVPGSADL